MTVSPTSSPAEEDSPPAPAPPAPAPTDNLPQEPDPQRLAPSAPPPLLALDGVSKSFGGLAALTELSFDVPEGAIVALVGPTGAGKSTLVDLIAGRLRPERGTIRWAGRDLAALRPDQVCGLGIACTFQKARPFGALTVEDNLMIGALAQCRLPAQARSRAREILALLDLTALRFHLAHHLTLEERIRLELARALATAPRLLVLDQGLTGLTSEILMSTLRVLDALNRQAGLTILLAEPTLHRVKLLADHVIWLEHGTKVAEGPPDAPVPVSAAPPLAPTESPEASEPPETPKTSEAPKVSEASEAGKTPESAAAARDEAPC